MMRYLRHDFFGVTFYPLLLTCCLSQPVSDSWVNDYDKPVHFECPAGQSICEVHSIHDNHFEDRRWSFRCVQNVAVAQHCFWSEYANDWDAELNYVCPNDGFISGWDSVHDNYKEDRRHKFKCCSKDGVVRSQCSPTAWVNDYDKELSFAAENGFYISGVMSRHDNHYEDRRWQFQVCKILTQETAPTNVSPTPPHPPPLPPPQIPPSTPPPTTTHLPPTTTPHSPPPTAPLTPRPPTSAVAASPSQAGTQPSCGGGCGQAGAQPLPPSCHGGPGCQNQP